MKTHLKCNKHISHTHNTYIFAFGRSKICKFHRIYFCDWIIYSECCRIYFRDGQMFVIEAITRIFSELNFSICYKHHENKLRESFYRRKISALQVKVFNGIICFCIRIFLVITAKRCGAKRRCSKCAMICR